MESMEPMEMEGEGPDAGGFSQVVVLVIEGLGIGALPDAEDYKDRGAATLQNLATYTAGLELPLLQWMGLGSIAAVRGVAPAEPPAASVGRLGRASEGADLPGALAEIFGGVLPILVAEGLEVVSIGRSADVLPEGSTTDHVEGSLVVKIMDDIINALGLPIRGVVVAVVGASDGAEVGTSGPISLARTLKQVDTQLGGVLDNMSEDSLLIVTGSSGSDATLSATRGPTREYVPLLAYTPAAESGIDLGTRASLADIASTLEDNFAVPEAQAGDSFYVPLLS